MKIVRLKHQLGNNIFQYAFALALRIKKSETVLLAGSGRGLSKYFELNFTDGNFVLRKFLSEVILKLPLKRFIQDEFEAPIEAVNRIDSQTIFDGFFQSPVFLLDCGEEVKKRIKIKKKYVRDFQEQYGDLFSKNKMLAIHYRAGDYENWSIDELGVKDFRLPISFYENAIDELGQIRDYKIIVVTDDKSAAERLFRDLPHDIEIVSNNIITDFQMVMNADAVISSNSTFCWWAAFLNEKAAEIVVPRYFLGFKVEREFPLRIYPEHFKQVPVFRTSEDSEINH